MVSELLINKLKGSIDKEALIFLVNNFRFECKIINCDDEFIEIYDLKKFKNKFIRISEISEAEIK
ncbi:MAG: hypothetical protein Q7S33_03905 [Nanoarchaeota archaeon]|nr:hypothetical protein [Nanoarchaeota archaeon]